MNILLHIDSEIGLIGNEVKPNYGQTMSGRPNKIDRLFESEDGQKQLGEMLLAITNRASAISAAMMIGVHPTTLSNWIARGKREPNSYYGELNRRVVAALGNAVCQAEIEVGLTDPKWYLTRGFGRALVGDLYNIEAGPDAVYNIDGTVSNTESDLSVRDEDRQLVAIDGNDASAEAEVEQQLTLDALAELRSNGIDINAVIDKHVESTGRHINLPSPTPTPDAA